jgi:hypothetical protein
MCCFKMMALLPIILFVTTRIYKKVKMYSKDEKTNMGYGECNKNDSAVAYCGLQFQFVGLIITRDNVLFRLF